VSVAVRTRNFRLMLVYRMSQHTPLYWPYMFLFVTDVRGLPASDFGLLKTIYYVGVMAAEVPLGIVADRFGRKTTLAFGAFMNCAGCALYALGGGFLEYAAAEACFAFMTALQSGAESALLFDGYDAEGRAHEFARATGALEAAGLAAGALAIGLSGLLLTRDGDPTPAYVATALLSTAGVLAALAFVEPARTPSLRLRAHVGETLRDVVTTPGLLATFAYGALVYAALRAANALVWNPVLERASLPLRWFGALTGVVTLLGAATAWRAHVLQRRLGAAPLAVAIAGSIGAMYATLALVPGPLDVVWIASHGLPLGVTSVLLAEILNRRIDSSERRATLLSFESLFQRGLYGALIYVASIALERHGLTSVLVGFALLGALALAFVPRMTRR
jgi:MFS family permease